MPAPRHDALASFVLSSTKRVNGRSLDQQWNDLAAFMKGPGSVLARWLAVGQMHLVYKQMKRDGAGPPARIESLTMRFFVERAIEATGVSRPTIYRYVERSDALVEKLGPVTLKRMLAGDQAIVNDEEILLKVAQLPPEKALKIAETYMRGGRSETAAARLVERYLHDHRLSELTNTHEPKLRGGSLVEDAGRAPRPINEERNVVYFGDALLHLREIIRPESVHVCITSPPFFGQRDFGTRHWFGGDPACRHDRTVAHGPFHSGQVAQTKYRTAKASQDGQTAITHSCSKCGGWLGQLGQESDAAMFVDHLVAIFREVRRVLRPDGVAWVEIGDTYNAYNGNRGASSSISGRADHARPRRAGGRGLTVSNVPNKSLLLVPQRLAVALLEDGWVVRSEVIWHKVAGLPESCHDRPTRAHTTILMLAKTPSYFYDHVAIMEPAAGVTHARGGGPRAGTPRKWAGYKDVGVRSVVVRNCRDVWALPVGKFPDAHTATFPPALPERCIRASTSEHGACASCGAPWQRRVHKATTGGNVRINDSVIPDAIPTPETIGWEPTCECGTAEVRPCIILDPFAGSGTTLAVAKGLGRDYVGIEINEREYRQLIERRLGEVGRPNEQRTGRATGNPVRRS